LTEAWAEESRGRAFLFLQGPPGPAFARLAEALRTRGCEVRRINFNGGDRSDWPLAAADFRGPRDQWPGFLAERLDAWGVTDIVLFGDCRPLHRLALEMAQARGLVAHVMEEGYLRPDWVTLELGGVNGNSSLPRSAGYYRRASVGAPDCAARPLPASGARQRWKHTVAYYTASLAACPTFPFYRTHRPTPVLLEAMGWAGRLLGRRRAEARAALAFRRLADSPYFLFPLQLNSDYQIRDHSPFADLSEALDQVAGSFAAHAPANTVLAVKQHPLDNGLIDWRRKTDEAARRHGLGDRLVLCERGDVEAMIRGSLGVVTVNSTSGTLALGAGRPVAVLGQAVYDLAGLTHQGPLEAFWRAPSPPDLALYAAFRNVLAQRCLISGGLFGDEAIGVMVEGAVPRLLDAWPAPAEVSDQAPRRAIG
jgi:capsular polysaccharide export protein